MVNTSRDQFMRRYATSPIHVPRLERLLAVYGTGEEDDAFCSRFIAWDRACPDGEAARIVAETLSAGDAAGRIARFSDDAVQGAIRWMGTVTSLPVSERARVLRDRLTAASAAPVSAAFVEFLASAAKLEDEAFQAEAQGWTNPRLGSSSDGA